MNLKSPVGPVVFTQIDVPRKVKKSPRTEILLKDKKLSLNNSEDSGSSPISDDSAFFSNDTSSSVGNGDAATSTPGEKKSIEAGRNKQKTNSTDQTRVCAIGLQNNKATTNISSTPDGVKDKQSKTSLSQNVEQESMPSFQNKHSYSPAMESSLLLKLIKYA